MKQTNAIKNGMIRLHVKGESLVRRIAHKAVRNFMDGRGNSSTSSMAWILIGIVAAGGVFLLIKDYIPVFWSKIQAKFDTIV
ncbi:hypothetical protein ACE41H_15375 [Paenibacillus enshidis]|uniref:Uncharacterized protein n=1 Tax=Paenibacillus enshidis TaxID=1458439 RepID=A0ABV5AVC0_9BACL